MWAFVTLFTDSTLYCSAFIKVSLFFITLWKVLLSYLMSWCHVCLDVDDLIFNMGAWHMTLRRPRFMLESEGNMWAQEFSSLASQILSFDNPLRKIQTNKPLFKTNTPHPQNPKPTKQKHTKHVWDYPMLLLKTEGKTESPSSPAVNV